MEVPVVKIHGIISRGVVRVYVDDDGNLIFDMSNGESINVGTVTGENGIPGVGITSIEQTTTSEVSEGVNIVTVTLTSGEVFNFEVRNGSRGEVGPQGEQGPKGDRGDSGAFVWSILDNGDFTKPVSFDGTTMARWTIDANGAVEFKDGYIRLTNSSAADRIVFMQDLADNFVGEVITVAVCDNAGEIHFATDTVPSIQSSESQFCLVNFDNHTCRLSLTSTGELRFQIAVATSGALDLRWAAMFKGEIGIEALSKYAAKGYAVELLSCGGYATVEALSEAVDEVNEAVEKKAETVSYKTTLLVSGWSEAAPYTQTASIEGILATDEPFVDIYLDGVDDGMEIIEAWACVGRVATADGTITAYCYEDVPSVDIPIILKVVR